MQKTEPKKNWSINSSAFQRLLRWLDEGENSDGQKYLEMRRRLVTYFDRKNCLMPDEFADETLNRVARRLEEENSIETEIPAKYCYITARFVFLEYLRGMYKKSILLDDALPSQANRFVAPELEEEIQTKEKMLDCLEKCTGELTSANRDLIIGYYFGEERIKIENRRAMAQKLGISVNALSIRACRIREKLEICVEKCASDV
jgi:DNA-directed RNA polymerase specialized sigma24 family protein